MTVAQEVETLKLYLEIERMRFEERLRTSFRISHEAADGAIPSLLLQPLIENAVKYAVSPQEEGAKISLVAQRAANRLRIVVSDTGPGFFSRVDAAHQRAMRGSSGIDQTTSTGVGLQNVRNRLSQAYGEDHHFDIEAPAEGGFRVTIELPFESMAEDTLAVSKPNRAEHASQQKAAATSSGGPSFLKPSGIAP